MKIKILGIVFCLFLSLSLSQCHGPKSKQSYEVKVIRIIDGDTFEGFLEESKTTKRYRLAAIDTPEKKQPYGNRAKQELSNLIFGQRVSVKCIGKDRYKREIVWVTNEAKQVIQDEMLKRGMAWHFTKYDNSARLNKLEAEARNNKIGLWADPTPVAPWDFRKQ